MYTHLAWADNWFLLAKTSQTLVVMARELTEAMLAHGLYWKQNSLTYMSPMKSAPPGLALRVYVPHWPAVCEYVGTTDDSISKVGAADQILNSFSQLIWITKETQSVQLGVTLTAEVDPLQVWQHRRRIAMAAFDKDSRALRSKLLSLHERMDRYSQTIPAIALFGCETWIPTTQFLRAIRGFEGRCLRLLHRPRRPPDMCLSTYMRYATRLARKVYVSRKHALLEQRFLFANLGIASKRSRTDQRVQTQWYTDATNQCQLQHWIAQSQLRRAGICGFGGKRARLATSTPRGGKSMGTGKTASLLRTGRSGESICSIFRIQ